MWNVNEPDGNDREGIVQRDVREHLKVAGTASGTLNGSVITWAANGNATGAGDLSRMRDHADGNGGARTNSIRVPYSGNTCVGPVRASRS